MIGTEHDKLLELVERRCLPKELGGDVDVTAEEYVAYVRLLEATDRPLQL
jgi:hypothetical protein